MSVPNKISVSGSLSHIMKVCGNLTFAMPRCKAVLPSENIYDPSIILRCTTAGRILGFIAVLNHITYTCMGQLDSHSRVDQS